MSHLFYYSAGYGLLLDGPNLVTYNWFEANGSGDVTGGVLDGTNRYGDPGLVSWTQNSDCSDDQLWPLPTSGLIDAGDPSILDPDGSRSDIGATGGPAADPRFHVDDDNDGFTFVRDCDDGDGAVSPDAAETCNSIDDDCDGLVDDGDADVVDPDTFYPDCDGDGQGAGDPIVACFATGTPPCGTGGWASVARLGALASSDCDDTDPQIAVGADELCAAGDQNCDGDDDLGAIDPTPFFLDTDRDGYGSSSQLNVCGETAPDGYSEVTGDCNDADPTLHPDAADPCGDGVDQDCNGADGDDASLQAWSPDGDGDGFGDADVAPTLDCADVPGSVTDATDCDDADPAVHPGAAEVCNGIDDDCVSGIDDGLSDCAADPDEPADPDDAVHPVGGCSTSGSAVGWLLLFPALAVRRRQARR